MSRHASVEQLSAYVDGELPAPRLRLVERHLEECADCRTKLAGMRRVVSGVRRLERLAPPPALGQELARRVRHQPRPKGLIERLEERLGSAPMQSTLGFSFALVFALAVILYLFAGWVDDRRRGQPVFVAPSEVVGTEDFTLPEPPIPTRTLRSDSPEAQRLIAAEPALGRLLERGLPVVLERDGEVVELIPVAARASERARQVP